MYKKKEDKNKLDTIPFIGMVRLMKTTHKKRKSTTKIVQYVQLQRHWLGLSRRQHG